jgi:hypothetical protein
MALHKEPICRNVSEPSISGMHEVSTICIQIRKGHVVAFIYLCVEARCPIYFNLLGGEACPPPIPQISWHCQYRMTVEWGTGVKTNAKGGADAQPSEKQGMWRHLRPERATTSFQMHHSQGMTFPIALSTSPPSPSCVSPPRIGLVPPVPHSSFGDFLGFPAIPNLADQLKKLGILSFSWEFPIIFHRGDACTRITMWPLL